jgi:T-complex protein 1 subunit zeta
LSQELTDQLTDIVTDACLCVRPAEGPIDLHMIEIMHMKHKFTSDTVRPSLCPLGLLQ